MSVEGREPQQTRLLHGKNSLAPNRSEFSTKRNKLAAMVRDIQGGPLKTLAHFIDKEWLEESWRRLNKHAAAGLDRVSAKQFAADLEGNLKRLLEKMQTGTYRSAPLRRVPHSQGQWDNEVVGASNDRRQTRSTSGESCADRRV